MDCARLTGAFEMGDPFYPCSMKCAASSGGLRKRKDDFAAHPDFDG